MMKKKSQLAAMTPPANSTKQKTPKRNIIFGCARCVMPKTTDVNSANNRAALNWVSCIYEAFLPLASECASTGEMMFNRPQATRYLVP